MGNCCCCCPAQEDISDLLIYINRCVKPALKQFVDQINTQLSKNLERQNIKYQRQDKSRKMKQQMIDSYYKQAIQQVIKMVHLTAQNAKQIAIQLILKSKPKLSRQQSQMSNQFTNKYQEENYNIQNLKSQLEKSREQSIQGQPIVMNKRKSNDNADVATKNMSDKKKVTSSMCQPLLNKQIQTGVIVNSSSIINQKQYENNQNNSKSSSISGNSSIQKVLIQAQSQYKTKVYQQVAELKKKVEKLELSKSQLTLCLQKLKQSQAKCKDTQNQLKNTSNTLSLTQNKVKDLQKRLDNNLAQFRQLQASEQKKNLNKTNDTNQQQNNKKKLKQSLNQMQKLNKQYQIQKSCHKSTKEQAKRQKYKIQQLLIQIQQLKEKYQGNIKQQQQFYQQKKNKGQFQIQTSFIDKDSINVQKISREQFQVQTSFIDSSSDNSKRRSATRKSIIIRLFKESKILQSSYHNKVMESIFVRQKIQNMFTVLYGQDYFEESAIVQTKILFTYDKINPNKYFDYIKGKNNLFLIAKLNQKVIFGGFIRYTNGLTEPTKQSFLFSMTQNSEPYIVKAVKDVRPINQSPEYINFGDNQLRIKSKTRQCLINVGCIGCQYKTNNGKADSYEFCRSSQKKFQVQDYQIYELVFGKQNQ